MNAEQPIPASVYWLVLLLAVLWGASWPFMKLGLEEMAPMRLRLFATSVGALGLFLAARAMHAPIALPRGAWRRVAVMSFFNMGAWSLLMIYGLNSVGAGRAVILAYTFPLWTIPLSAWLMHEPVTRRKVLGLAVGLAGMALLLGDELFTLGRSPLGALLLLGSAVSWAVGTVVMKRWPVDLPAVSLTAWQSTFATVVIAAYALPVESGPLQPFGLNAGPLLGVLYNAIVSGVFCQWAWYRIVAITPPGVSSLSTLAVPPLGVFLSMPMLGERPQATDFAALALVVAALAVVLLPARSSAVARTPAT